MQYYKNNLVKNYGW